MKGYSQCCSDQSQYRKLKDITYCLLYVLRNKKRLSLVNDSLYTSSTLNCYCSENNIDHIVFLFIV